MRREQPASGPANLGVAEIEARTGNPERALALFQRAIYGSWPPGEAANREQATLELIDALVKAGKPQQAVAELQSLVAGASPHASETGDLQRGIAQRFSALGIHNKAAALYREIAARDPRDAHALQQLGVEELALGDTTAACTAFRGASQLDPAAKGLTEQLAHCEQMRAPDPALLPHRAPALPGRQ